MGRFESEIELWWGCIGLLGWMRRPIFHIAVLVVAVYWHAADEEAWQEPGWFPGQPCSNSASKGMVGWFVGRPCSDDALEDLTYCDAAPNLACALARVKATCLEDDASYTWANCAGKMTGAKVVDLISLLPDTSVNHTEGPTAAEKAARRTLTNRKKRVLREMRSLKAYMGLFKLPGVLEVPMIFLNMLGLYVLWSGICILSTCCLLGYFWLNIMMALALLVAPLMLLIEVCTGRKMGDPS
eukprot:Skav209506  [mRNA]  locus=scaffold2767:138667:139389:+ [translate_table: standard]